MSRIKFETGQVVNFDGTPTPRDIDEVVEKLGIRKKPENQPKASQREKGIIERFATHSVSKKFGEISEKTFGRAGSFMFGTMASGAGSVIGSGVESVKELFGKPTKQIFTKEAEKRLGNPWSATKTIGGTLLEGTTAGLGKGIVKGGVKLAKKPLTILAEKLYRSGMKPRDIVKSGKVIVKAKDIVKIGIEERIWLTKGGVEKTANKINNLESALGDIIEIAQKKGVKINTKGLKEFVDIAKDSFKNQVDVKNASKSLKEIDNLFKNFIKKYGDKIPIEKAQKIKVNTYKILKNYYDKKTSIGKIEGEKQLVRGLKEAIVKKAPKVGEINQRLSDLYKFDQALGKAKTRISNLNLLGLGTKAGTLLGGAKGFILGKLLDLADAPALKSAGAIGLDVLTKGTGKSVEKSRIPISVIIANLTKYLEENKE